MDNNNNPQMPTTNMPPSQPPVPQAPLPDLTSENSNKMILWLVIGLVVIVLVVGGIYLFLSNQQVSTLKPQTTTSQVATPPAEENLENDLDSINVEGEIDSNFASVDQDLGQL